LFEGPQTVCGADTLGGVGLRLVASRRCLILALTLERDGAGLCFGSGSLEEGNGCVVVLAELG
jgi:hypothetical protein